MILKPTETELKGKWIIKDGNVIGDSVCERIDQLISNDLKKVATDKSGWEQLFIDPNDGRYWELVYPHGEWQGGGPPMIKCVSFDEVKKKYSL